MGGTKLKCRYSDDYCSENGAAEMMEQCEWVEGRDSLVYIEDGGS